MNIEGLSEATLEKFIGMGFIHEFADIFRLEGTSGRVFRNWKDLERNPVKIF